MSALLIVLVVLGGYLAIGGATTRRMLPTLWERGLQYHRYESRYPDLSDTGEKAAREGVIGMAVLWLLFWPLMFAIELLRRQVRRQVDAANPHEQQRRIKQQSDRIDELERELGIQR